MPVREAHEQFRQRIDISWNWHDMGKQASELLNKVG